jgi:Anti-sigma-K factor rskA/Putative zinc-finger
MSCEHRDDVGAWVLGALPEDEHERFAAHLSGCEVCRREVAELQMVADTLPLAAPQLAPPPELKERIMAQVRAEAAVLEAAGPEADAVPGTRPRPKPKRRFFRMPAIALRPIPVAVAAAVLIALGVGGGILLSGGPSGKTVQAQVVAPAAPGARASLTVADDRATLKVDDFPAPPPGRVYQVWLKRPGRPPDPTTALFRVRGGNATVDVPGSMKGVDQVLVTAEPDGGSMKPTSAPVVVASAA